MSVWMLKVAPFQQYVQNLGKRAVAYLNMDMSVRGNYTVKVKGVPLMYQTAYKAAKQVSCIYLLMAFVS